MVHLYACVETETTIFLILQYARYSTMNLLVISCTHSINLLIYTLHYVLVVEDYGTL